MQEKLPIEILKEGFEAQKKVVEEGLAAKARFVKAQFERELTDQVFKRVKIEEEHIINCAGLLQSFYNLIDAYETELQSERSSLARCRELNDMFSNDAKEYREKYYETLLKLNGSIKNTERT